MGRVCLDAIVDDDGMYRCAIVDEDVVVVVVEVDKF